MLGPTLRGKARAEALGDASRWLERVGLSGFEKRYPSELSGGQRKRVAMAQALINRLPILLMDESFSALDVQTRALMEDKLLELWQELRATVLFVTHDLEEAIAMGDRVLLFTAGVCVQRDTAVGVCKAHVGIIVVAVAVGRTLSVFVRQN